MSLFYQFPFLQFWPANDVLSQIVFFLYWHLPRVCAENVILKVSSVALPLGKGGVGFVLLSSLPLVNTPFHSGWISTPLLSRSYHLSPGYAGKCRWGLPLAEAPFCYSRSRMIKVPWANLHMKDGSIHITFLLECLTLASYLWDMKAHVKKCSTYKWNNVKQLLCLLRMQQYDYEMLSVNE